MLALLWWGSEWHTFGSAVASDPHAGRAQAACPVASPDAPPRLQAQLPLAALPLLRQALPLRPVVRGAECCCV